MEEIFKIIFGDYSFAQLFGFAWFFLIGIIIYGLNETTKRNKKSLNSPEKWCWSFWWKDNWRRYLTTILSTYILFRFYLEFVGHPLSSFEALLMGLVGDGIGATAKKRLNIVSSDRKKLLENPKYVNNIIEEKPQINEFEGGNPDSINEEEIID